jgi:hypothetical protein
MLSSRAFVAQSIHTPLIQPCAISDHPKGLYLCTPHYKTTRILLRDISSISDFLWDPSIHCPLPSIRFPYSLLDCHLINVPNISLPEYHLNKHTNSQRNPHSTVSDETGFPAVSAYCLCVLERLLTPARQSLCI